MKITRESIINVEERQKVIANSLYVIRIEKEALIFGKINFLRKFSASFNFIYRSEYEIL